MIGRIALCVALVVHFSIFYTHAAENPKLGVSAPYTLEGDKKHATVSDAKPEKPGQQAKLFEKEIKVQIRYEYLLSLPENYKSQKEWPLVLFLHGSGECGTELEKVKKNGPPKYADEKPYPFILVSPQCPGESWDIPALDALVDDLIKEYRADKSRVYVTGLSLGGGATWHLIAHSPEKFAAAVPVCGWNPRPKTASKIKDIPLWIFHGDQDKAVPVNHSKRMIDALKPLNGAEIKFTLYPGVGHDCWNQAYAEPELWNWLLAQKKK